jgi:hypothetical protein
MAVPSIDGAHRRSNLVRVCTGLELSNVGWGRRVTDPTVFQMGLSWQIFRKIADNFVDLGANILWFGHWCVDFACDSLRNDPGVLDQIA